MMNVKKTIKSPSKNTDAGSTSQKEGFFFLIKHNTLSLWTPHRSEAESEWRVVSVMASDDSHEDWKNRAKHTGEEYSDKPTFLRV